jgi:hypothetical protein
MAKKVANKDAGSAIANREDFEGSSLRGRSVTYTPDSGRLAPEHAERLASDNPSYVVSSYGTPIAWHGEKGWTMPAQKHSVTTSKHQTQVRNAIGHFLDGHDGARQ